LNIINKISGGVVGTFTGILTFLLQTPYAYYVFAQQRRTRGDSWLTTLLLTATVGNFFALATGFFGLATAWGTVAWGVRVGWSKGITGAIKLPLTFHTEFQERLISENITNLFWQFGSLIMVGVDYFFDTDFAGNVQPSEFERDSASLREIQQETSRLQQENSRLRTEIQAQLQTRIQTQHELLSQQMQALDNNRILLERMDAPATPEQKNILLLTESEIETYKKAILGFPEKEQQQYIKNLADYIDKITCPITQESSDNPITVVLTDQGPHTYDSDALKKWIQTREKDARDPISNIHLLKDLDIYKGYSAEVINFITKVQEINKQWGLELARKDQGTKLSPAISFLSSGNRQEAARARLRFLKQGKGKEISTTPPLTIKTNNIPRNMQ
jgi:hypothetical protein